MWTAWWKNPKKVEISDETEFLRISQHRHFRKVTTQIEKHAKRQDETKARAFLDMYHMAIPYKASSVHFATANFYPFRTFPVWMQTIKTFINTVFMRENHSRKCYQKPLLIIQKNGNIEIFGIVVLYTQLHEEMHWRFPIANNSDYCAFRTLIFVSLCRLHFWSDCNDFLCVWTINLWDSKHSRECFFFFFFFFSHGYRVIQISKLCTQTGSVRSGWKVPVAKWAELALYGIALCFKSKKKKKHFWSQIEAQKFCFLSNFNFVSVFQSGAPRCSHPHCGINNPVENLVKDGCCFFFRKMRFYIFCAPKLSITT